MHNYSGWEIEDLSDDVFTVVGFAEDSEFLTAIPGAEARHSNSMSRSRFRRTAALSRDASQSKSRSTRSTVGQLAWVSCQGVDALTSKKRNGKGVEYDWRRHEGVGKREFPGKGHQSS